MLKLVNISKAFGDKIVFDKLNEEIRNQEFVFFCGESGCGKTTLLHMIGGLEKPDSGEIIYNNNNIYDNRFRKEYFRNEVGFVFQNFALIEQKTVRQNLNLIKKNARSGCAIDDALLHVGLKDVIDKEVYKLSGGEQQRVALARLLMKKCSLILADEPTGSLDGKNAELVMDILRSFQKEGRTIIVVTHDRKLIHSDDRIISLGAR